MAYPAITTEMLQVTQTTDYVLVAAGALVAYDKVLTFSQEFDYMWNRRWTFPTALYLVARYSGDLLVIGTTALNTRINWTYSGYVNMSLAIGWAENIFLLAMQAILVIRVYALFNQSRKVLIFLAISYVLQATASFVIVGLVYNERALHEYYTFVGPAIGRIAQPVLVNPAALPSLITLCRDSTIYSIVFDTILLLFALWAFVIHTLEAKTLDGGWSINVLVRTLIADHLLYFVCNLIWLSLSIAISNAELGGLSVILLNDMTSVFNALVVVFGPRMVVSLRTTENKTRGEGGTLEGEVSTIRFGVREPPTQSESNMEEGGGFRAVVENAQID
ncbi:hypothetical protein BJ138DRAFT_1165126 [Hygrophoropsis aurantiaca]|uniref:Uncharacterized protein n=1 Tax=Hygrophoropsis aurantiaca TaxID=72124 RepID=A0ACB7ZW19_9AGAM|nr:hypothetical protein BJ138DRAFT_1165126 [Hygrophoropsis aurantiaca]